MAKQSRQRQKPNRLPEEPLEMNASRGVSFSGKYEERRYLSELPDPDDLAKIEI